MTTTDIANKIDYSRLPDYMREGMRLYIEHGVPVGHFLTAVLENNLMEAYGRADDTNAAAMHEYAAFLYNEAPRASHGSREAVSKWMNQGGLLGLEKKSHD